MYFACWREVRDEDWDVLANLNVGGGMRETYSVPESEENDGDEAINVVFCPAHFQCPPGGSGGPSRGV